MNLSDSPPGSRLTGLMLFIGSVTLSIATRASTRLFSGARGSGFQQGGPPIAKKIAAKNYFGKHPQRTEENRGTPGDLLDPAVEKVDHYAWMRDDSRENEEVLSHIKKENAYAEAQMAPLAGLIESVYQSMLSRLKETDEDVPYPHGPFAYYSKTFEGKAYKVHARRPLQGGGKETVLLDENVLAQGWAYSVVGSHSVSPDHSLLAYTVDRTGDEHYLLQVKNVATGELLPDSVDDIAGDVVWSSDGRMIFYTKMDEESRPFELWVHVLGSPADDDLLLFSEPDQLFGMEVGTTANEDYLLLGLESKETSEVHFVNLRTLTVEDVRSKQGAVLRCVEMRKFGVRYEIEAHGLNFLVVTNKDGAKCHKLCSAPVDAPGSANWVDIKAYDPRVQVDSVTPFRDFVAVFGRQDGLEKVWTAPVKQLSEWAALKFSEPCYSVYEGTNAEFNSDRLRLVYSSLTTPRRTFDYVFGDKSMVKLKQQEVPHYDKALYSTCRINVAARDGVQVPVSLVFKTSLLADPSKPESLVFRTGAQKCLLYGYGSYGASSDPYFDFKRMTLLDHDIVYAIAHIRGGGEMGQTWYEDQGKYLTKLNTFNDFADVAKALSARGVTRASKLACVGRSAGGLLVGAVINREGHLFKCAVADVPFVDVCNSMSDPSIPLTVGEWEEWGNPNERKFHDYMMSYSPYDCVEKKAYPALLVTGGLHDHRVAYWEPLKWVAKLRELKTDSQPLILKIDCSAGHFSASDRYKYLRETAFEYAFIINELDKE